MNFFPERRWAGLLLAALLCGCGQAAPKSGVDARAFEGTSPEIRQTWDQALAAADQKDFGVAITTLRVLSRQGLSAEQQKTVFGAIQFYEAKLRESAKSGDPAAVKAMKTLGIANAKP